MLKRLWQPEKEAFNFIYCVHFNAEMRICVIIEYYFTLKKKKKLACTICILISCIGHSQHLNVGNFNDVFDIGLKSGPVGLIIYGSLFIWHLKLFKITKRKIISSQMFYFAFFLWFSANIVTHVIFKFYLNSMRYMCIII